MYDEISWGYYLVLWSRRSDIMQSTAALFHSIACTRSATTKTYPTPFAWLYSIATQNDGLWSVMTIIYICHNHRRKRTTRQTNKATTEKENRCDVSELTSQIITTIVLRGVRLTRQFYATGTSCKFQCSLRVQYSQAPSNRDPWPYNSSLISLHWEIDSSSDEVNIRWRRRWILVE